MPSNTISLFSKAEISSTYISNLNTEKNLGNDAARYLKEPSRKLTYFTSFKLNPPSVATDMRGTHNTSLGALPPLYSVESAHL